MKKTHQFNISVIPIGHKVIAVDLPGYGKSSKYDGDRGEFLIKLIKTLSPNVKPILVSPSMSGTFSLPLLNKEPDLICGYIPGIYVITGGSPDKTVSISTVPSYNRKKKAWIPQFNIFFYIYLFT